jgi:lipopolysaccharide/colanic/teichoic acid biosynthesis glycosyltransferase
VRVILARNILGREIVTAVVAAWDIGAGDFLTYYLAPINSKRVTPLVLREGCRVMSQLGKRSVTIFERRRVRGTMFRFQEIIKRGFDIAFAIAGLLLLSPLMLLISLGIKSESAGPIVCRHKRYGLNNAAFEVFEFRTTLARQEEKTFTHIPNKIRYVTRFGQLLRQSGMDKIPQLVNVLRGEMSIVGPRAFATVPRMVFHLPQLHKVRPGLVSWAQVNVDLGDTANSARSLDRRIEHDRYYLENRSVSFDVEILLLTLLSRRTYL